MLGSFLFSFQFARFCQSGWYIDFFLKKTAEVFVRNVFVYTSLFFAEKYIIEGLTKKIFSILITNTNKWFNFIRFTYITFFLNFLGFFFYSISAVNLIIIFLT